MKIGIFGGSFNPPHNMHKKIALELIQKRYVDQVIFVPTGDKYQKENLVSAKERYQMVKQMIKNNKQLLVSDYEIKNKLTYTYETLNYFKNKYPKDEIYFICGSDNLLELETWNHYQYILEKYKIIVVKREDDELDEALNQYMSVIDADISLSNLSSTKIRELIKENKIEELGTKMDSSVIEYIQKENLYRK